MTRPADRIVRRAAKVTAAALLAAVCTGRPGLAEQVVLQQPAVAIAPDAPDGVAGKEHNEFVFVRDSAVAQDKFNLATKMERLKEWNKSADLYQEVLRDYRDRVIPDGTDSKGVINRYTSVTWGVLRQLAGWPPEGLAVYRGRYEPEAARLLSMSKADDLGRLHHVFQTYFVTESGKQAGLRLIDANLERGEYLAAAEIGDQLLNTYPKGNLQAERPGLLFRTAVAYALAGDPDSRSKSQVAAAKLKTEFPTELGTVRGNDVVLADALAKELELVLADAAGGPAAVTAAADSWPTFGGGPTRGAISSAHAIPGTRLYSVPLAPVPNAPGVPASAQLPASELESRVGVMPVVDRGELYFQDGSRVYAVSLESGVPLPAWAKTYATTRGQYVLPKSSGPSRQQQQTLSLTDRHVLAVMGQPDRPSPQQLRDGIAPPTGPDGSRLVCLDRATGKEAWTVTMSTVDLSGAAAADKPAAGPATAPAGQPQGSGGGTQPPGTGGPQSSGAAPVAGAAGSRKNEDEAAIRRLTLSGAPLVVGDTVLTIGRSNSQNQGEDCYVLSFDLNTGRFRWACYVASSGMPAPMYGMPIAPPDNTSHLAYSNGRVYVQTNLGAVAALDAYGGTIVWLNIYPLDVPQMNVRGMHMGIGDGRQNQQSRTKPWQANAPVVVGGKLFVLPNEGKNLLVYDAVSGKEFKRIQLDVLTNWVSELPGWKTGEPDRLKMLLGVTGDKMLLAGDRRMVYFDWVKYDAETFPGDRNEMEQIVWPYVAPFVGRPFLTASAVYTASSKLEPVDLATGIPKDKTTYPVSRDTWDDGEGPGNIVVSGDHVVVAGATGVDVYTDLALATAKLDAELAAAPADADLRLRYAEVMFVAGQGDQAVKRLDEAVKLMGGEKGLRTGPERDRLFNDAITFAVKSAPDGRTELPGAAERTDKFFDRAALAAATPQQHVQYRMARAKFAVARKDAATALALYQEVLAAAPTRAVTVIDEADETPAAAADVAERAVAKLIKPGAIGGPAAYEKYEAEAKAGVAAAEANADLPSKAAELLNVAQAYPNATVSQPAMMSAADAYESAARPRDAVRVLRTMYFKYQSGTGRVAILEGLARNYLAVPDRSRTDLATSAAARLAVAATGGGEAAALQKDLKLADGTVVAAAGTTIPTALEAVRKISSAAADRALPDFRIPPTRNNQKPYPKPFQPIGPQTTLPDATALVLPSRDFARPDRVVTWSPKQLSIFGVGGKGVPTAPLSKSDAFPDTGRQPPEGSVRPPDAPRGVAWANDVALVWGGSRVVAIDANSGKTLWTVDAATLPALEVLRGDESPGSTGGGGSRGGGVVGNIQIQGNINGRVVVQGGNGLIIRNGMVVNAGFDPAGQPAEAAAKGGPSVPVPPTPGGGEQVADVRPVGDRALVTTSTGRIACVDLAGGTIAWQTRLADTTADRLVANEDFTVVRVRDDQAVRLVAMDTFSGRVLGRQSFPVANGRVPLNVALSADGKLVYTLPDQLCMRDLYEGWDKDEKAYPQMQPGRPMPRVFEGAVQPGQLVIAEGRVLALSDNTVATGQPAGTKFVSVYSLESLQPITLTVEPDKREVNLMLATGEQDWNVTLRTVGSKLYAVGTKSVYAYDLDRPEQTWSGSTKTLDLDPPDMNLRDAFIGTDHIVVLDQPGGDNSQQFRLHAFARYPSAAAGGKGESGKLDHNYPASDPAGVAPQWQAANGGFYYATADGKVRVLMGNKQ